MTLSVSAVTLHQHKLHDLQHSLTELSPSWEAANCAATKEIPSILWNPKVQCRVDKSPPLVPILSSCRVTTSQTNKFLRKPLKWGSVFCTRSSPRVCKRGKFKI
jgi:hypothetical protein